MRLICMFVSLCWNCSNLTVNLTFYVNVHSSECSFLSLLHIQHFQIRFQYFKLKTTLLSPAGKSFQAADSSFWKKWHHTNTFNNNQTSKQWRLVSDRLCYLCWWSNALHCSTKVYRNRVARTAGGHGRAAAELHVLLNNRYKFVVWKKQNMQQQTVVLFWRLKKKN